MRITGSRQEAGSQLKRWMYNQEVKPNVLTQNNGKGLGMKIVGQPAVAKFQ
jgi:hypothetical protein